MKNINKLKFFSLPKAKSTILFVLILVFWWTFLSGVDFGKTDVFHDRDQDGLTDEEENMYGTDVNNPDTDGDGYRDGIEVESGYDPLKPAPGDKIVFNIEPTETKEENKSNNEPNLTDQFFEKLTTEKGQEIDVLSDYYVNPEKYNSEENFNKLNNLSLTSDELQKIISQTTEGINLNEEMDLISEEEIKVLSKVSGSEKKKKKKEKEQIEKYLTQIFYVMSVNKPFAIEEQLLLPQLGVNYINGISGSIQLGQIEELKELKEKAQKTYDECIEIETPYKTKDLHQRTLSLIKYLIESIDEEKVIDNQDPLTLALYVGKLQAAVIEGELIKTEIDKLIEEYEIEIFDDENLKNIF